MPDQTFPSIAQLQAHPCFAYLTANQQALVTTSIQLQARLEQLGQLDDYAFLIFPASKAYEGFLKQVLLDQGLINQETYRSRRFRIGRALNPDVWPQQRDKLWFFDDLLRLYGKDLADQIWQTWLSCRNHIFHFFPGKKEIITLAQAENCLHQLLDTMAAVVGHPAHNQAIERAAKRDAQ